MFYETDSVYACGPIHNRDYSWQLYEAYRICRILLLRSNIAAPRNVTVVLSEARYSVMWKMCSLCRNMCDLLLEDVFPWYTLWWQLDSAQCGVFRIGVMVMVYVDIFDSKEPAHAKLIWKNYPPISNINERRCLTGGLSSHLISCVHTWSTSIETSDVYTELNCPDNIDSPRHGRRSDIDQRVLNPQSFQHCAIGIMPISRERKVKQD